MANTQRVLEEACFDCAKRLYPDVLANKGWKCAAQVELSEWVPILKAKAVCSSSTKAAAGGDEHLHFIYDIRDSAVHRLHHPAAETTQLLRAAVRLLRDLEAADSPRAKMLDAVRGEVELTAEKLKLMADMRVSDVRAEFRAQRKKLQLEEEKKVTEVLERAGELGGARCSRRWLARPFVRR